MGCNDNEPPLVICPSPTSPIFADPMTCAAMVELEPILEDSCMDATLLCFRSDGLDCSAPYPVGITTVTYTAYDIAGNNGACSIDVIVENCEGCMCEMETSCCDSSPNLIINGDFESELFGLEETDFVQYTDIQVSSILPGGFGIVSSMEASTICENWLVDDLTTNCDGLGNFMVVNGRTGLGKAKFWEQTINNLDTSRTYKFCASFRHLEQCCFDVLPTIEIIVDGQAVDTFTIQTDGANPCNWYDYTYTFAPTNFTTNIQFFLEESSLGDGNDFAIDNIQLLD